MDKYALKKGQALDLSFADIDTRPKVGGKGGMGERGGVGWGSIRAWRRRGDYFPD